MGSSSGSRFGLDAEVKCKQFTFLVNILNLFDQDAVLTVQNTLTNGQIALTHTLGTYAAGCPILVSAVAPQFVTVTANAGNQTCSQSLNRVGLINAYNRGANI